MEKVSHGSRIGILRKTYSTEGCNQLGNSRYLMLTGKELSYNA
jgi:hypothetical protein